MYIVLTAFSVTFLFWLNYHMGKGIFGLGCVWKKFLNAEEVELKIIKMTRKGCFEDKQQSSLNIIFLLTEIALNMECICFSMILEK